MVIGHVLGTVLVVCQTGESSVQITVTHAGVKTGVHDAVKALLLPAQVVCLCGVVVVA